MLAAPTESAFAYLVRIVSHTQIEGFQTTGIAIVHAYLSLIAMFYLLLLSALIIRARPRAAENQFFALLLFCEAYKVTITWYFLYPFGPEILGSIEYVRVGWYYCAFLSFLLYLAMPVFYPIRALSFLAKDLIKKNMIWCLPICAALMTFGLIHSAGSIPAAIGGVAHISCTEMQQNAVVTLHPGTEPLGDVLCQPVDSEYLPFTYILTQQKEIASLMLIAPVLCSFLLIFLLRLARKQLAQREETAESATEARALAIGFAGKALFQGVTAAFVIYMSVRYGRFSMTELGNLEDNKVVLLFLLSMYGFMFSILVAALFEGFMFTYAILKDEVLGIDEQLRRTFTAAVFATLGAVLFLVSTELMESLFDVGWLGGVAIGLPFIFFNKPILAAINGLSTRLMPETHTATERSYLEAYAFAMEDGVVTDDERRFLEMQAKSLGLDSERVAHLEAGFDASAEENSS